MQSLGLEFCSFSYYSLILDCIIWRQFSCLWRLKIWLVQLSLVAHGKFMSFAVVNAKLLKPCPSDSNSLSTCQERSSKAGRVWNEFSHFVSSTGPAQLPTAFISCLFLDFSPLTFCSVLQNRLILSFVFFFLGGQLLHGDVGVPWITGLHHISFPF